ncbi:MAG: O-antigen ligase family protein [Patescibacteria group bacterium]
MLILMILIVAAFGVFAWKQPVMTIGATLAVLPSYLIRFSIGSIPFTLLEGIILIQIAVWGIQRIRRKDFYLPQSRLWLPTMLFLLSGTASIFIAPNPQEALGIWKAYLLEPIVFCLMIVTTIKTADDLRWVRHGFAILVGWISLYAILQWIGGFGAEPYISEIPRRASSIFPYPNALGLLLAPILVYLWHHAHERWVKGIIAIGILGLLTTVSQGAWLATAGGIFFSLLFTRWRKWTLIGSFTALLLLLLIAPTRTMLIQLATFQDVSGDVRLVLWQGTWNLLRDRPMFGAGLGGFAEVYDRYRLAKHTELLEYPHNMFLDAWVELGLLGLVSFIWLLYDAIREGMKRLPTTLPLLAVFVAIMLYGLVDVPYFKNDLALLFWIWMGLLIVSPPPAGQKVKIAI